MLIPQRGFTLTEMAIAIAIVAILTVAALPNFTQMLQNAQIKAAAQNTMSGLNLARAEALRRNMPVSIYFVSDLTDGCTLSSTGSNWVVSLASPASHCATAPVDASDASAPTASDPKIVQKYSGQEGGKNATVAAFLSDGTTASSSATFTGLGRVSGGGLAWIDIKNSTAACEHESSSGTMRCLRILISTGGQAKLCDPKVSVSTDPRYCS